MRKLMGIASLLLAWSGPAMAEAACSPERARGIQIGRQDFPVETAVTPEQREHGLSERARLAGGAGMWFVLPEAGWHAFWMRGVKFPIDLVWVSPSRRVLEAVTLPICNNLYSCPLYSPPGAVAYVLEVNAGEFAGRVGDSVAWRCGDTPP